MDLDQRAQLEQDIRSRAEGGDIAGATDAAIRGYGPEVFAYLAALQRDAADETFALFCEGVWRGLGSFAWQSSFRTWAYTVARNIARHYRRDAGRRAAREGPLPSGSALSAIEEQVRTATATYLKTQRRSRLVELRDSLPEDDRTLLMLRVDRQLAWADLALVMHDGEEPLSAEALRKESARLRKRFQLVKEKLYEMARREGLIEG
jgi:RNA polymerase sigma-70 factor (ECF subfamily)